jgi:hypothetical protein
MLGDTTIVMLPVDADEIGAALSNLKISALLRGWRGGPAADISALVEAVLAIQAFGLANAARLEELEVNPLIVCEAGHGAFAVDALMRMREEES